MIRADLEDPRWIVHGMIPAGTIVLVAGDAGVGKSVMNLSEALHIALGRSFMGHPVTPAKVLYFDEENSRPDLNAYVAQLWRGMGSPSPDLWAPRFKPHSFSLGNRNWPSLMTRIVQDYRPDIIYIDTATSAFNIVEENDNAEAQRICHVLRHIMADAGMPAIKLLKHAKFQTGGGHGGPQVRRTIRGAKSWLGAVDQVLYHIRRPGRPLKSGLRETLLIPDKTRAYGLRGNIRVIPSYLETAPKGLVLKGESFESENDLMIVI